MVSDKIAALSEEEMFKNDQHRIVGKQAQLNLIAIIESAVTTGYPIVSALLEVRRQIESFDAPVSLRER